MRTPSRLRRWRQTSPTPSVTRQLDGWKSWCSELSERIEEHFVSLEDRIDTLDEAQRSSEEKRSRERRDDLTLTLFLFFLQTYLAFFLVMLDALTAGG